MSPVPTKTVRLTPEDRDRTAYFSVSTLMARAQAVAARSEPSPQTADAGQPPAPAAALEPPMSPLPPADSAGLRPSVLQQLREASPARKATLLVLPLLIGLLAVKPVFKKPRAEARALDATNSAAPGAPGISAAPAREVDPAPLLAPTASEPLPPLPKGVTLERAASDALSGGDFRRALAFYRELSRQSPSNAAYREAARILERKLRQKQDP